MCKFQWRKEEVKTEGREKPLQQMTKVISILNFY